MKKIVFVILSGLLLSVSTVRAEISDTISTVHLQEVSVVSSIKDDVAARQQPASVSMIDREQMQENNVTSLKGVSALVPNLFIPDYGSRLTSAIYVRGIGSRINTPAVGLYVDNIPYMDKSAFDFNLYDIERIDVLRGPQGVLYGRNTMGGLVRVFTKNPFVYKGTDVHLGYATKDNHCNLSATHYQSIGDKLAFTVGGYFDRGDGFFRHGLTGNKVDGIQAGGGKVRGIYKATDKLTFDLAVNYDYTDEDAYPYYYTGTLSGEEQYPELLGMISANRSSQYYRGLLNAGLNIEYKTDKWQMNAVTSYQNIKDRMYMDQDFIAPDIYTLEQKQRINTINEEVIFKNLNKKTWEWVTGVSLMYQTLHTDAPVVFYEEGTKTLIEDNVNGVFRRLKATNPRMPTMGITLLSDVFGVNTVTDSPTLNASLFHQSRLHLGKWTLTAGLRLEYEKLKLKYLSNGRMKFDFDVLISPGREMAFFDIKANADMNGKLRNEYFRVLPKLAVQYNIDEGNNVYLSVSEGLRSGGYNLQMMADLSQANMKNGMMEGLKERGGNMVAGMMKGVDVASDVDVNSITYKPEYSWNYEMGTHLTLADKSLLVDAAVFYSRIYNQQIARFSSNGLGRMMVNAGLSHCLGFEASVKWRPDAHWTVMGNYGYTNSKFLSYEDGKGNDYEGRYVPFVPQHTMNFDASYLWNIKHGDCRWALKSVVLGANCTAAGRLFWTEKNDVKQPFYAMLGAYLSFVADKYNVVLWGRNLTNTRYNTFYFESANRGFEQHGKPLQIGVDINLNF